MSFIRKKTVPKPNGKKYHYYYLVSNKRVNGQVKQNVEKYIGKTLPQAETEEKSS